MLLSIEKAQSAMSAVNDAAIKNHLNAALDLSIKIDKQSIGIAYEVAAIKPFLEGNTSGFPTKFEEFAIQTLGVKKSQAYNILAIGQNVVRVEDENGKNPVYIDKWTSNILTTKNESSGGTWRDYYKACRKHRTLGSTQILTIISMMNKREIEDSDIETMLEDKTITADTTIKRLNEILKGSYRGIETAAESKTEESKTEESKTEESKTEESKTGEVVRTVSIEFDTIKEAYPEMCRVAEECPAIAKLVHILSGIADIAK